MIAGLRKYGAYSFRKAPRAESAIDEVSASSSLYVALSFSTDTVRSASGRAADRLLTVASGSPSGGDIFCVDVHN